jgi:uncharacterized membrane protein YtjA (UPF0391 family)
MDQARVGVAGPFVESAMLSWSIAFLLIAILAGLLGFSAISGMAAFFAKVLFFLFLALFVWSLVGGRKRA